MNIQETNRSRYNSGGKNARADLRLLAGRLVAAVILCGAMNVSVGCGRSASKKAASDEPPVLTRPVALNDAGMVVGGIHDPASRLPAFELDSRLSATNADVGSPTALQTLAVPPGASWVLPSGLNAQGDIVGLAARAEGGTRHAVVWQKGQCRWLDDGRAQSSEARAINNRGEVMGVALDAAGARRVYQWNLNRLQDAPHDIAPLTRIQGRPDAINDRGDMAGWRQDAQNRPRLFLYRNGTVHDLGAGYQIALNNGGQMAGASVTMRGLLHACAWSAPPSGANNAGEPTRRDLPTLPDTLQSAALALNDRGQIVGRAQGQAGSPPRAVLWQRGQVVDLNTLIPADASYTLEEAVGVNNGGQILCAAREKKDFRGECALLTPSGDHYTVRLF